MKRDMDLVRLLLLKQEGERDVDLTGYSEKSRAHHLAMLIEAGFMDGSIAEQTLDEEDTPFILYAGRLTWKGHDFLDAARSETIWRKALARTREFGSSVSFDVLKQVLVHVAAESLGVSKS